MDLVFKECSVPIGTQLIKGFENTKGGMQFRAEELGQRCWLGSVLEETILECLVFHTDGAGLVAEQVGSGVKEIQILTLPLTSSVALGLDLVSLGLCFLKCKMG